MPLADYIPKECLAYVRASGKELLNRIGHDELREIVTGVLCGENVRSATEPLTRRRLATLNAAILVTLVRASQEMSPRELLEQAQRECRSLSLNDPRRVVLMWILGLTNKQVQNVLRSDDGAWSDFVQPQRRWQATLHGTLPMPLDRWSGPLKWQGALRIGTGCGRMRLWFRLVRRPWQPAARRNPCTASSSRSW